MDYKEKYLKYKYKYIALKEQIGGGGNKIDWSSTSAVYKTDYRAIHDIFTSDGEKPISDKYKQELKELTVPQLNNMLQFIIKGYEDKTILLTAAKVKDEATMKRIFKLNNEKFTKFYSVGLGMKLNDKQIDQVIYLQQNGLPEDVIAFAMLKPTAVTHTNNIQSAIYSLETILTNDNIK